MSKKPKDTQLTGLDGIQKAKVRQDYTDKELAYFGSEIARSLNGIRRLRDDMAESSAEYQASISKLEDYVNSLVQDIRRKHKLVDVNVKAEFDAKANRKKLFTMDGEFIREEKMTDSDHQIALPIATKEE